MASLWIPEKSRALRSYCCTGSRVWRYRYFFHCPPGDGQGDTVSLPWSRYVVRLHLASRLALWTLPLSTAFEGATCHEPHEKYEKINATNSPRDFGADSPQHRTSISGETTAPVSTWIPVACRFSR